MSQWLVNTQPTFRLDVGTASVGSVTVTITRGDGTAVVTGAATTDNNDGTYDYTLAVANNDQIDQLKLDWTFTSTSETVTTFEEITGGLLFTVEQARGFSAKADATSALKPLGTSSEYSDATIIGERARILDDLEFWTGRGWVPRYCRLELNGNGHSILDLNQGIPRTADGYRLNRPGRLNDIAEILSVTIGGTAATVSNFEVDTMREALIYKTGVFAAASTTTPFNVVVEYVYGLPFPVDGVDRIGLKMLVDRLVPSAYPDRALRIEGDYGSMQLVQPGGPMGNVSRVPEVNDWVSRHNHKILLG